MIAIKKNPKLWEKVKKEIQGDQGWDARKAQRAVKKYKKLGGEYIGKKGESLEKWTRENWQYIEGTKRYLPKKIIDELTTKQKKEAGKNKKLGIKKKYPEELKKIMKQKKIF